MHTKIRVISATLLKEICKAEHEGTADFSVENSGEIEVVVELTEGGGLTESGHLEADPDRVVIVDRVFNVFDLFREDVLIFKDKQVV